MRILSTPIIGLLLLAFSPSVHEQMRVNTEKVTFMSGDLRLAGTLYLPTSAVPTPAVVLIHGSGQVDRSSMAFFANVFAESGVAALAYDKRGVGQSQGSPTAWRNYNFEDLAADAAAGVGFLRARADIDSSRIGVFGASQGGWVAPLVARRVNGVRFLVLVSASVTTVAVDNLFERAARLKHEGFTDAEVAEARAMHLVDLEVSRSGDRFDEFALLWNQNKTRRWFPRVYGDAAPAGPDHAYRKWYRTVMNVDPVPTLRELDLPALWLFGDPALDLSSPVLASVATLEGLRAAGKAYQVEVFPGADHSLQIKGKASPFQAALIAWLKNTVFR